MNGKPHNNIVLKYLDVEQLARNDRFIDREELNRLWRELPNAHRDELINLQRHWQESAIAAWINGDLEQTLYYHATARSNRNTEAKTPPKNAEYCLRMILP